MESCLSNAVTRKACETSRGATDEAQVHSNSIETSTLEARFETVKKAGENAKNHSPSPKIQKVIFLLRDQEDFKKYYEPRVVSLGPIHHGKEKYKLGEKYKLVLTYDFVNGSGKEIKDLYKKIEENIKELKECFEEEVTKKYDDEALAWLLFVDGCAILQYIYCATEDRFKQLNIKTDSVTFGQQDLFLLENQLPYRLLKWLMGLSKMEKELRVSIETFVAHHCMVPDDQQLKQQQTKGERGNTFCSEEKLIEQIISMDEEPVHLLDHLRTKLLGKAQLESYMIRKGKAVQDWQSYRNIQELKAAGIRLKRSDNSCLRNIRFSKQILLFGHLYLPPIIVDDSTRPKFLNLIAYEMCLDFENDFGITSYISFLDSLIDEASDVKMLRKARILHNLLGSDEEVAQLFNKIGNDLVPNPYLYLNVKSQIQGFYDCKCTTWMAQFIHDHFSSPWTFLAFCGVLLGLGLTAAQTWYAVKSSRSGP
ncbi:hypothetical protein RGQ29_024538 [Quercus rubra]|uniref:Uncharacterized protein n=1 Tax=Quercus rubra TaxID=3512 RepID=A0AAN7EVL1_QUERU|nr:hypothetical protein RGQ29_024538 [Quercus rubra]